MYFNLLFGLVLCCRVHSVHELSGGNLLGGRELVDVHELYWGILFDINWSNLDMYFDLFLGQLLCCGGEWLHELCRRNLPSECRPVELHELSEWNVFE